MHRLLTRQLRTATKEDSVDIQALLAMVSDAYDESDRDRRRTDRSMTVMIDEVDQLNEQLSENHSRRLAMAIDNMAYGVSLFDANRKLIICNDRYLEIYGLPKDCGKQGTPIEAIMAVRLQRGTLPVGHHEGFVEHILQMGPGPNHLRYELPDGRIIAVTHTVMPDDGFVGIHRDITDEVRNLEALHESRASLMQQNLRFDAAINNIAQGLCMFDGAQRLVICNLAYSAMYALPAALTLPGASFADILAHRTAQGSILKTGADAQAAELRERMDEGRPSRYEHELMDGRIISIQLHPMPDGGWVATHEDVTEQRAIESRIRHLARHDPLTDLPNRVLLREELDRLEARIDAGEMIAVLCFDLDNFKGINDTLGHAIGDEVLVEVARRLHSVNRSTDVIARLGGDEFAILASNLGAASEAGALADRITRTIVAPIEVGGREVLVGSSIGIAVAPFDGTSAEALLRNADLALYRAKSEGRGGYCFFELGMDEALQHRRTLEQGLRAACARREFQLFYQPIVNLKTGRICGFEALLRWERPGLGPISPLEFVPIAEELGIINQIGGWALTEACRTAARWPADIRIAVNLSASQFKSREVVDQVITALAESGLGPERLEIEITESLLLSDTALTLEILHQLRQLGIRIAMDDFGTGYSSLRYLRAFPFDKIKIDRSFINGVATEGDAATIVSAVINLSRSLGMTTVAEGIETEAELEAVRAQGCQEAQGFLFSPALPARAVEMLARSDWTTAVAVPSAIGFRSRPQAPRNSTNL